MAAPAKNLASSHQIKLGKINILSQAEKKPSKKIKLMSKPDEEKKEEKKEEEKKPEEKPKEEKKEEPKKEEEKKDEKKDEPKK